MSRKKKRRTPILSNSNNLRVIPYRKTEPDLDKVADAVLALMEEMVHAQKAKAEDDATDPVWNVLRAVEEENERQNGGKAA